MGLALLSYEASSVAFWDTEEKYHAFAICEIRDQHTKTKFFSPMFSASSIAQPVLHLNADPEVGSSNPSSVT